MESEIVLPQTTRHSARPRDIRLIFITSPYPYGLCFSKFILWTMCPVVKRPNSGVYTAKIFYFSRLRLLVEAKIEAILKIVQLAFRLARCSCMETGIYWHAYWRSDSEKPYGVSLNECVTLCITSPTTCYYINNSLLSFAPSFNVI